MTRETRKNAAFSGFSRALLHKKQKHRQRICDAQRVAFDLDLRRPVKPRWPNAGLKPWVTRQDAGLAVLGQGWPMTAAHGFKPERGHTEPGRGAEWWGKSVLLTLPLLQSEPP